MRLLLLRIEYILLHTEADIVGVACKGLATDRRKGSRQIVANLRLHEDRVLGRAELLESAEIGYNLRDTNAHLLKLAEAKALAVRGRDAHVRGIVEHIDILVAERHVLCREHEAATELLDIHPAELELALVDLEKRPATLLALVADTQHEDRLCGILYNKLYKRHDQNIIALARLVAIEIEKQEHLGGKIQLLPNQLLRYRKELLTIEPVQNDIDGASDALVFQTLLPVRREGEDTVRVAIQDIQVGLQLGGVDLVAVDPDLEGARDARLTNLLRETSDDRHVVVDENHVGRLLANYIGQSSEAEPLGHRLLEGRRIDYINIGRVSSEIRRGLGKLLETEMSELEPGLLSEFIYEIVGDLGVSCELL